MGRDYRTGHNGAMIRLLPTLLLSLLLVGVTLPALAWNGAGHRLVAAMAWRQMTPGAREAVTELLAQHPDQRRWPGKTDSDPGYTAFLAASTWPDDIRNDPRFYDEDRETATPALPGLADTARHKTWHYVDFDDDGRRRAGELDRQIDRLALLLRDRHSRPGERTYALPWLIHLVADIHQPLHVGSRDDEGGNRVAIENPLNPRFPFTNLHAWWDDLPGPPWLRGKRLEQVAEALLATHPLPQDQGDVVTWLDESRSLSRRQVYPDAAGDAPATITLAFRDQSRRIANDRLAAAGYRLGRLLESIFAGVPRETP